MVDFGHYDEKSRFDYRVLLNQIPDLKGQIIGGHTIVWGHTIEFKKFTSPIYSKYGYTISENAGMRVECSCGWFDQDILPKVTEMIDSVWHNQFIDPRPPQKEKKVNFQKLESIITDHIQGTYVEMDYITIPVEFLEDCPDDYVRILLNLLKAEGAVVHFEFDTRMLIIVDDNMSDAGVEKLTDMLAGYDSIGTKKVRVLKNGR